MDTILGIKSHMEQAFTQTGVRVPVTVVRTGPNLVVQVKTREKDGYDAIQLGFGVRKVKNTKKPLLGHLMRALTNKGKDVKTEVETVPRFLREVRTQEAGYKPGDVISPPQVLKTGDLVQVTGVSKGKGFAGVVKRWGFAGGPKTHGQSDRLRAPGSIGRGTTPGRVVKGQKMAGRMGGERVTVKNLKVVRLNEEKGEIWLSGLVPGARGSLVVIKKLGEARKFEPILDKEFDRKELDNGDGSK
jgi:large subunit ribosomal protein L3